ncbi:MAG: hypothetical protein ACREX9_22960 [Gammaproteobacteria bacterium]
MAALINTPIGVVVLTLVGAVVGTVLSIYVPAWRERRQYKRRKEFFGTWLSAYQSLDHWPKWVDERVNIDLDLHRFRIDNSSNGAAYDYIAYAELVERTYLKGQYYSNRPGANAFGAFVLCISPRGNMLYGYWIGPNDRGERRYAGWVIGRTRDDIQTAKKLLTKKPSVWWKAA